METAIAIIGFIYWAATWSTLGHALLRNCGGFIDNVAGMTGRFDCLYCGKTISLLAP
jgi:hypothetical protein